MSDNKCVYCSMEIHTAGKMAWWQGAEYGDGVKTATIQADDAACEHFELWVENTDAFSETEMCAIPINHCPWCGRRLR